MPTIPTRVPCFGLRDSGGNNINLLNDAPPSEPTVVPQRPALVSTRHHTSYDPRSTSTSSLNLPELMRSNSYDSHDGALEPKSPTTPSNNAYDPYYASHSIYPEIKSESSPKISIRPVQFVNSRENSFDGEHDNPAAPVEREAKRYPCRFKEKFGCDRTFTTSGHASRHSKIHTAEKSVACSWIGCTKKFTRADNMKQHLETHNKAEKSRGSGAGTIRPNAGSRRTSTVKVPGCSSGRIEKPTLPASPGLHGVQWDTHGQRIDLPTRPHAQRGLSLMDVLSLAAEKVQEDDPSRQ